MRSLRHMLGCLAVTTAVVLVMASAASGTTGPTSATTAAASGPRLAQVTRRQPDGSVEVGHDVRACHFADNFYAAIGEVVNQVLVDLGFTTTCPFPALQNPYPVLYPAVGDGSLDLLSAKWDPAHAAFYKPLGDAIVDVVQVAQGYFFIAVPDYVDIDKLGVSSIADLAKPDVMAAFNTTIVGIDNQSFLESALTSIMASTADGGYGLADAGWNLAPADIAAFDASIVDGVAAKQAFVFPAFAPSFLTAFPSHALKDPLGLEGPTNSVTVVKHAGVDFGTYPNTVLSRAQIGTDAIASMAADITLNGVNATTAAHTWIMANRDTYDSWFRDESAAL